MTSILGGGGCGECVGVVDVGCVGGRGRAEMNELNEGACLGAGGWDGGEQDVPGYGTANSLSLSLSLYGVLREGRRQTTTKQSTGRPRRCKVLWLLAGNGSAQARTRGKKPLFFAPGVDIPLWMGWEKQKRRREGGGSCVGNTEQRTACSAPFSPLGGVTSRAFGPLRRRRQRTGRPSCAPRQQTTHHFSTVPLLRRTA